MFWKNVDIVTLKLFKEQILKKKIGPKMECIIIINNQINNCNKIL